MKYLLLICFIGCAKPIVATVQEPPPECKIVSSDKNEFYSKVRIECNSVSSVFSKPVEKCRSIVVDGHTQSICKVE